MGVGYKIILNLPDVRLVENKKNLKREFPSRKSKKKLSSHHLSFPEGGTKSEFKSPVAPSRVTPLGM